jgi:hypothetical protein
MIAQGKRSSRTTEEKIVREASLLHSGLEYARSAIAAYHDENYVLADDLLMHLQVVLADLLLLHPAIDEFRTVLLGLHNAFFHLEGMPLPKNQALAVQWALEKIQSWAIFGFDAALPVIEALNNAGLNTSTPPCRSDSR